MCLSTYVCVRVYVCMFICMYKCVCTYVWRPEVKVRCLFQCPLTIFFSYVLSLKLKLTDLALMTGQQVSVIFLSWCSQSWSSRKVEYGKLFYTDAPGTKLWFSGLHSKLINNLSDSQSWLFILLINFPLFFSLVALRFSKWQFFFENFFFSGCLVICVSL